MSISSKSPRKVALVALAAAKESLPEHPHPNAPKKFTQPQLFACLVLKRFYQLDYRGIWAMLRDWPAMRGWLGLRCTPHWTTLHQAAGRLLAAASMRTLLTQTVDYGMGRRRRVGLAAADSTGFRSDRESRHYTRRRTKTAGKPAPHSKRRFPKATLLVDTSSHLILAALLGRGPRPDVDELAPLLAELVPGPWLAHLLVDAGFDSEANHRFARHEHGILTTIPPRSGRPSTRAPTGYYRRLMARTLHTRDYYGQRWQVETVNSMIKRNQGDVVLGHTAWSRRREMRLAVLTHNIALLLIQQVLYGAYPTPFWGQLRLACRSA